MKNSPIFLLLIFIITSSSSKCKKNEGPPADNPYGLPNATQTGAMVFACRINGQSWNATRYFPYLDGKIGNDTALAFANLGNSDFFLNITLTVCGNLHINQTYPLNDTTKTRFYFSTDSTCLGISGNVVKVFIANGSVTLTRIDSVSKIISGIFAFNIPIPSCDSLQVTYGRFDINY
jgi:hypothetical protein